MEEIGEQEQVAEIAELPVEQSEVGTPEPQVVKTFTQEEVDAIKAEIKREEQRSIKGLQRVVSKKDDVIRELKQRPSAPEDTTSIEYILQMAKSNKGEYGENDPLIPTLEAELNRRKQVAKNAEIETYKESIITGEREKLEAQITEAGFDPEDERFEDAFDMWDVSKLDGKFERAHRKLDRILKTVKLPEVKEESTVETKRKEMLASGTTKVDVPGGGGSSSDSNFVKQFASGTLPVTQANIDRYNKIINTE